MKDKKEIQEERMKNYFVQATKEILKAEGIHAVSVRNVADRAGYSFATMYNYFKDIKELIFCCVQDFLSECEEFVRSNVKKGKTGPKKIKALMVAYTDYFVQYPGVFDLLYIEKPGSVGSGRSYSELIASFPARLCDEEWKSCIADGTYSQGEVELMKADILYAISGLLVLYMNRHYPQTHKEFIKEVKRQMDRILKTDIAPAV